MLKNNFLLLSLLVLLAGIIVFIACNKHLDGTLPSTSNNLPDDKVVSASLQGRVLDENGLPVKDAAVTSGTAGTTTDVNGVFVFSNISMSSRFGFVKVVKQGYFTGSRSITTNAGSSNFVTISLLPRASKGSFVSSGGGVVVVQTGDTVKFGGSAVVNAATNAAYSGSVHVFAAYLNPTDADLSIHMPGDLRGIGTDGKETALQTFGMMVVELEGDAGEKLQIASGKHASITMAIPASLQGSAPSSIPLWYFNDTTGKWIAQGTATRSGNNYMGQVGHFSFWNCDAPMGAVGFKVRLKDQHGNALAYTRIQFVSQTVGTGAGYTDSAGYAEGLILKGQSFRFQVLSLCNTVIFEKSIGSAQEDLDLGTVTVSEDNASLTLTGKVIDCYNSPVISGYVNILIDGLNYRSAVVNGAFTMAITRCSSSSAQAQLTAGDYIALQQGSPSPISVTSGKIDAGQLSACGTALNQFITVTVNGASYSITVPPDSIAFYYNKYDTSAPVYSNSPAGVTPIRSISFEISHAGGTGAFPINFLNVKGNNQSYYQGTRDNNAVNSTITRFGDVNGFVEGTLTGFLTQDSIPGSGIARAKYPMTGSFRIKRTM